MSRPLPYAAEIARGIAEVLVDVVWLPKSLRDRRVDVLAAGLAQALQAFELPDLPRPAGSSTSIDAGGILDAVAGLLPSPAAAVAAGRRFGNVVADLLAAYPTSAAASSPAAGRGSGSGPPRGSTAGTLLDDPDLEGPYTLPEAVQAVELQVAQLGRLYPRSALAAAGVTAALPAWRLSYVGAIAMADATIALQQRGLLFPSSVLIGNYVHQWLEGVYLYSYVGGPYRFGLPGPARGPFSEVVQERRVYFPSKPSRVLSELATLSSTFQKKVRITPAARLTGGPRRYNALWIGMWSPRSLGNLKPDTLDFTRRRVWEIKPASRAPEAVAQLFQYVNGYNLASAALPPPGRGPRDVNEARAVGPGGGFPWPSLGPIPVVFGPPSLAVPFTLTAIPGLVAYVVVDGRLVLEQVERLYKALRDAVREALRLARKAAGAVGDWIGELGDDLRDLGRRFRFPPFPLPDFDPLPAPALVAWGLAIVIIVALIILVPAPGGAVLAVALIAAIIVSAEHKGGRSPGTVPVLTPEGGFGDESAFLDSPPEADESDGATMIDSPLGDARIPVRAIPALAAAIALWANICTREMTEGMIREATNVLRQGAPPPPDAEPPDRLRV